MSKTFLRHTLTKNIFDIVVDFPLKPRILNPYLYTFSLYENPSFTIVSYHRDWNKSNRTDATSRAGTAYRSLAPEFTPVVSGDRVARSIFSFLCSVL